MLGLLLALAACSPGYSANLPAAAYRHLGDRMKVYLNPFLGQTCGDRVVYQGHSGKAIEHCFRFGASRRMTGVVVTREYGPADFYPGAVATPKDPWISRTRVVSARYRLRAPPRPQGIDQPAWAANHRAFVVTFIGRETPRGPGRGITSVVTVDRVLQANRLPDRR